MKRLFILALSLGLATASYAAIPVPTDKQNLQVDNPLWAGAATFDIGNASGTTDELIATGKGILFGVLVTSNTGATTDYVVFRDTATANHTSTILVTAAAPSTALTQQPIFAMSVKFVNGLCATMASTPGVQEHWTVLYRLQSDQL